MIQTTSDYLAGRRLAARQRIDSRAMADRERAGRAAKAGDIGASAEAIAKAAGVAVRRALGLGEQARTARAAAVAAVAEARTATVGLRRKADELEAELARRDAAVDAALERANELRAAQAGDVEQDGEARKALGDLEVAKLERDHAQRVATTARRVAERTAKLAEQAAGLIEQ